MYEGKLRLISLFGKDDGTFTYAQGQYYDYSGGNTFFLPFKRKEDAIKKLKELVLSEKVSDKNLALCDKWGFEYPDEKVAEFKASKIESINKNISQYSEQIDKWKTMINEI